MQFQMQITSQLLDGFWILVAQMKALDEFCSFPVFFKSSFPELDSSKTNKVTKKIDIQWTDCRSDRRLNPKTKISWIYTKY